MIQDAHASWRKVLAVLLGAVAAILTAAFLAHGGSPGLGLLGAPLALRALWVGLWVDEIRGFGNGAERVCGLGSLARRSPIHPEQVGARIAPGATRFEDGEQCFVTVTLTGLPGRRDFVALHQVARQGEGSAEMQGRGHERASQILARLGAPVMPVSSPAPIRRAA